MAKPKASHQGSIDWALVGDKVCDVLVIARDNPPGVVEFAGEQSVPYESVVAAAITQMVADYVEAELAKKSRSRTRRSPAPCVRLGQDLCVWR